MKTSESTKNLLPALGKAQSEIPPIAKTAKNPFHKSNYAPLNELLEICTPILDSNNLVANFGALPEANNGWITFALRISHTLSGEFIETYIPMPVEKVNSQGAKSAHTYAHRTTYCGMLGIPTVDDDGEGTMNRVVKTNAKTGEEMKQTNRGFERTEETIKAIEQVIKEISEIRTFNKLTVEEATKVMGKKPTKSSTLNELKEMRDALADFMERRTTGELSDEELKLINGEVA